mmetsp:Transcript_21154/g.48966  ORF Transcript_21154/g.48966 Transcript_21154/m.48966 type:complete len:129 (+) Transcript_21154:349-735(+)
MMANDTRLACRVQNPNQHIYKVYGAPDTTGYVMMEESGPIGKFNRAQRAHANWGEIAFYVVAVFVLAAYVFQFQAFCALITYFCTRIVYMKMYSSAAKDRGLGLGIGLLVLSVMEGMCALTAYKSLSG